MYSNLDQVLMNVGQLDGAIATCRQAIRRLKPSLPQNLRPRGDPALMGKESLILGHVDRKTPFEVTRIDDDHFVVRRIRK
jgi:hypothetical protein